MKQFPMIGISGSITKEETQYYILRSYTRALTESGAVPVLLTADMSDSQLLSCADRLDGLLFAGGNDLAPDLFHENPHQAIGEVNPLRDQLELRLARAAMDRQLPVLGICRGIQLLNVALGGNLWQDLPSQNPSSFRHQQTCPPQYPSHEIHVEPGTLLHRLLGEEQIRVNSFHHQAVREAAPELSVCAYANDGVIEGVEHPDLPFFLGVQWHPERTFHQDASSRAIFAGFVEAARS